MANNRRVLISNLPQDITSSEIIQELFKSQNFKYSNINLDGSAAIVTLANANEAKRAAKLINGQLLKGMRITVSEAPPMRHQTETSTPSSGSSFVVVGNLPFDFTEEQFRDLMSPHGDINNSFLVRGKISKKSKGYGFVEYRQKGSAVRAKDHFMKTKGKFVEGRIIRVEPTSPSLSKGEAKHSRTLFVDKLPKSFDDEEQLINVFSSAGNVTYCKVARTREGHPRGYALLDYATVLEAEKAQQLLDGTPIGDFKIRISFCTPGKTAQDIFGKFDDQTSGGQGHSAPRIPNLLGVNTSTLISMEGFAGGPGFPQPVPLRTPFGIGGIPPMPRPHIPMNIMRPPGPIPGPTLRVPVSLPGPNLRTPPVRTPGVRSMRPNSQAGQGFRPKKKPNVVTITPSSTSETKTSGKGSELGSNVKAGQATKEIKQSKKVNQKEPKDTTKGQPETKEIAKEPPKAKDVKKEPAQAKETSKDAPKAKETTDEKRKPEEKQPEVSTPDPLAALQKIGESAVAAAMSQSSAEGGQVKVLQPVVFMDTEQLKQFQQFQELMKQQKEAEKSGGSVAISLEDLVAAAKGLKAAEKTVQTNKPETDKSKSSAEFKLPQAEQKSESQNQEQSKHTQQNTGQAKSVVAKPSSVKSQPLPASSKSSPVVNKPSTASTTNSAVKTKSSPSPATKKPSPVSIKLSPAIANSSSIPARLSPSVSKRSPGVSKPSPVLSKPLPVVSKSSTVVSKANVATKSLAPTKPSQARSTQSKQETQRPAQRQEKTVPTASSRNSYQRTPQHQQRSQVDQQQSLKVAGTYERDRNSYHESKPANNVSRSDGPTPLPSAPLKPSGFATSLIQKLFSPKNANKQEFESDQRTSNQADSRNHYGSPYQSEGKSNLPVSEASRGTPKSSQQMQYGFSQQYQSTDGRDYASKRSPANDRESPASQSSTRARYTLPERLPQARGNGESSHTTPPRYERNQERELISYPRPRSEMLPRQDTPFARDVKPPYVSPQSRDTLEPRDPLPSRDIRSIRDSPVSRNVSSLRDILPARDSSPLSRDTLPPRDRSSHDYLPRDLPPRNLPPRDVSPRDMPRSRDTLPPRDLPSRDILPSRGMPPRDDRYTRDLPSSSYMREMESPRDRDSYNKDSPLRYQSSAVSTREALDRARYERAMAGSRDARSDYPAYGREPDGRYGRDLPTRESAMGTIRGPPARYPMEGPQSKRPRY